MDHQLFAGVSRGALALFAFAASAAIADGAPNLRYEASPALTPLVRRLEGIETDRLLAVARLVGLKEAGPPVDAVDYRRTLFLLAAKRDAVETLPSMNRQ